ncbi:hypothetical protein GCG54_00006026 [Colletotrichum gloeosporioides]|uniref:CHAT domain-containing protein n=1 Tax=Colletotrichum gloeosporioides TaxID=474922 RepID=A0A8H4CM01_COLGL|nr:uncharacterized protein GCG54_00006026 [Colletotrichum gloeosporioides]KAF3806264.1 hypothetical protein GCG54_00006026 [Colletotrichum gloeosporioides]
MTLLGTMNQLPSLDNLEYYNEFDKNIDETAPCAVDEAAKLVPTDCDSPEYVPRLKSLVTLLVRRFRRTAAMEDLQHAILRALEMVVNTPRCHPDRAAQTKDWINMTLEMAGLKGFKDEDLEEVFEMAQQMGVTVKMIRRGHDHASDEGELTAASLHIRYQGLLSNMRVSGSQLEQIDIFDDETLTESVDVLEVVGNGRVAAWSGYRLYKRFDTTDSMDDLNSAIELLERALKYTTRSDHESDARQIRLTNLGGAYGDRFERTGWIPDLERAIELTTEALDSMNESFVDAFKLDSLACSFSGLETWLSVRFERFGLVDDLHKALDAAEMAVNLTPRDSPWWPGRMNDVGLRLSERFDRFGDKEDLDRAIECMEMAVAATVQSEQSLLKNLTNLGNHLHSRFKFTNAAANLDRAVEVLERALAMSPPNHFLRCINLNNLAVTLEERFQQFGRDHDLDRAIDLVRTAIDETPKSHPGRIDRIQNLGLWLDRRARQSGSKDDNSQSIAAIRAAIEALPPDHPKRPRLLDGLGGALGLRFEMTASMIDLEDGIAAAREAVSSTPATHHQRAGFLNNLANLLGDKSGCEGSSWRFTKATNAPEPKSSAALDETIEILRLSINATEERHTDLPSRLSNLGNWLGWRFRRGGSTNMDDIDNAIEATKEAVEKFPRANPARAGTLDNLGCWLLDRYRQTGNEKDQTDALECFKEGWRLQNAAPFVRIRLATDASRILAARSDWKEANQLLEGAINLLPAATPRSLQHTDKQDMLAKFTGLASTAAAVALNAGKSAYDALRLLELGRGIIASLLLDMRGDISDLKAKHPSLATEFLSLRDELDSPGNLQASANSQNDVGDISAWELQARKRRATEKRFGELVREIQAQDGFRHFCGVPDEDEFKAAAVSGPLVVINVARYRCDAFLIQHDSISVLELPDLTKEHVQQRLGSLKLSLAGHLDGMNELLEWLWASTARPCLDALNFTSSISGRSLAEWPRIWWIPTGLLSHFPLHAAGEYRERKGETVLDRVMSSYALSLRSLIHGRRHNTHNEPDQSSVDSALLLAMPTTPNNGSLFWAQQEVDIVASLCPSLKLRSSTPRPYKDEILMGLQSCKVFHFAGHGKSDPAEPSQSCLLLRDCNENPLTIADLRDHRLQKKPFLGYLSACSTGANEAPGLADEGIHLINSLQLAGFRHVVGTLWEVSDQHCVNVARVFYETLKDEGMTDVAICRGLHQATRMLRDGCVNTDVGERKAFPVHEGVLSRGLVNHHWIPYVHFGV